VRIRDIETSKTVWENYPILVEAAETLGSIQVRNKATIGGNICNASPSADMVPPLIALDAEVKIVGKSKEKVLPLGEFFKNPGKTALESGEILTEITIPHMVPHSYGVYLKHGRRKALDLAIAGVASVVTIDPTHSKCVDIRIVLGAVAPTAMRAKKAEAIMRGSNLSDSVVNEAAKVAAGECMPIDDVRASEWYRRQIVEALVKRSINQAINKVKVSEEKTS
jgi:carbon-monoxide dehydrogenase medium subunit